MKKLKRFLIELILWVLIGAFVFMGGLALCYGINVVLLTSVIKTIPWGVLCLVDWCIALFFMVLVQS
jgi:hypothetical protein